MLLKENASTQKLNGRYFTPRAVADYITKWVLDQNITVKSVLEPSCGEGVFLECLRNNKELYLSSVSIELDSHFSKKAALSNSSMWFDGWNSYEEYKRTAPNVHFDAVVNEDFYFAYKQSLSKQKYQAIIGNPPYIRFQYLTEEQREEQSEILVANGMHSNKLINAWVSFVVACVSCLDDNSRIGLVLPAELLQVKYSEELRHFLSRKLNKMTIITFEDLVFDGIEQEVVLLLGEKDTSHDTNQIRIVECNCINDLPPLTDLVKEPYFEGDSGDGNKWTRYFLNTPQEELLLSIEKDNRFIRFSDIARCEVGITTGNNKYFCLDEKTVKEYDIEEYCRPLIARSVNIRGVVFTKNDWQYNILNGARTYLLDLTPFDFNELNEGAHKYISHGENNKDNATYKCRIRDEWYKVPSVWSPDAFFLRRNYLFPKLMLNSQDVNAVSTDTMHRVCFMDKSMAKRAIVAYYNSLALTYSEIEGRSYGGGVLEILPGEVNRILIPNIFNNDVIDDKVINALVETIDTYMRSNSDIQELLDITDKTVLIDSMNMDTKDVRLLRDAWQLLRKRRLSRGKKLL